MYLWDPTNVWATAARETHGALEGSLGLHQNLIKWVAFGDGNSIDDSVGATKQYARHFAAKRFGSLGVNHKL